MKKLMIATAAAAVGLSAVADVYNVKFTATTTVAASKKVKGEVKDYLKKGSVVVNGLYDTDTAKYYFWTGSGAKMVPVQNAIFESQNEVDMDSKVNGKNVALNAGFYAGKEGELETAFIAAGLGKVLTVGGTDLNSASGSFAGKYEGNPAYGTWAYSKNASATKKGVEVYIADLLKKTEYTLEAFGDKSAELKDKLDAWREVAADAVKNAVDVKNQLAEIAGLKSELADKTLNVKELENNYGVLEKEWNDQKVQIAEQEQTIADQKNQLNLIDGAFAQLNDNETVKVLEAYLEDVRDAQAGIAKDAADLIANLETAVADYKAKKEAHEASRVVNAEYLEKRDAADEFQKAAKKAVADAIAYTNYLVSVKEKSYYAPKQAEIDAQAAVVATKTAERDALINGYIAATNAIVTTDWPAYETKLIGETNKWTTIRDNAIAAQAAAKTAYDNSDFVKYTTEDGEADWSKWLQDNDLEENLANRVNFVDNVYPAMVADGKNKKDVLDAADEELVKAQAAYDAKVPGYVEILDLLATGEADKYIKDLLAAAKETYDYDWAVANKEVEKAQAKQDELQAEYDAAWNLKVSDAMIEEATAAIADREAEYEAAKKAYNKAYNAWYEKNQAMKAAKTDKDNAAAAVAAILGVNPETEGVSDDQAAYVAKYTELRDTALGNVAAAEALLSRMGK